MLCHVYSIMHGNIDLFVVGNKFLSITHSLKSLSAMTFVRQPQ